MVPNILWIGIGAVEAFYFLHRGKINCNLREANDCAGLTNWLCSSADTPFVFTAKEI